MTLDDLKLALSLDMALAVDLFYDMLLEDDQFVDDFVSLSEYPDFLRAVADSIDENWHLPLGFDARCQLLRNWVNVHSGAITESEKRSILVKFVELESERGNSEHLLLSKFLFYRKIGYYRCCLEYIERLARVMGCECFLADKVECLLELEREDELMEIYNKLELSHVMGEEVLLETSSLYCQGAYLFRYKRDYCKALDFAKHALSLAVEDNKAWPLFEVAANSFFSGEIDEAEDYFLELLQLSTIDSRALEYRPFVELYMGNPSAAKSVVEEIVQQENSAMAYCLAAEVYSLVGEFYKTEEYLKISFEKGLSSTGSLFYDCAFVDFFEKRRMVSAIPEIVGKIRKADFAEYMVVASAHKAASIVAMAENPSFSYAANLRFGSDIIMAHLSTANVSLIGADLASRVGMQNNVLSATRILYNPLMVENVPASRMYYWQQSHLPADPSLYNLGNGAFFVADPGTADGNFVLGVDQLSKMSGFELFVKDAVGTKTYAVDFHFAFGYYAVYADVIGKISYNSDSVACEFILDTLCPISYINRSAYNNFLNTDGSFPLVEKKIGEKNFEIVHCDLRLGDRCLLEDTDICIVDEEVFPRIGLDVLGLLAKLNFNNENMKLLLTR